MKIFFRICILLLFFPPRILLSQCIWCGQNDSLNTNMFFCIPIDNNIADYSGLNAGIGTNSTFSTDRFNNSTGALQFNGTNSYMIIPSTMPNLDEFTLSVWLKPEPTSSDQVIFFEGNSECGNDLILAISNGNLYIRADKNGALLNGVQQAAARAKLPTNFYNTWHKITWVFKTYNSKLFIDSTLILNSSISGNAQGYHFLPTFGCMNDGNNIPCGSAPSAFYKGLMDDLRFYKYALSDQKLKELFEKENNNFSITKVSPVNLCSGDSIQLSINGGSFYIWKSDPTLSNSFIPNPYVHPTQSQKYYVTVNSLKCSKLDSIQVNVDSLYLNLLPRYNICPGNQAPLPLISNADSFKWSPYYYLSDTKIAQPICSPNTSINYTLTAQKGNCIKNAKIAITNSRFSILNSKQYHLCKGDTINISYDGSDSVRWLPAKYVSNYKPGAAKLFPPYSQFLVAQSLHSSCDEKDSVFVQVNLKPEVSIFTDTIETCQDTTLSFSGEVKNANGFYWTSLPNIENNLSLNTQIKINKKSELIYLNAYDKDKSCLIKDSIYFHLNAPITPYFTLDPEMGYAPLTVTFINKSVGAAKYFWNFDDNPEDTTLNRDPIFTFYNPGFYTVRLTTFNTLGCKESLTRQLNVLESGFMYFPTAFTPNLDGINDLFVFKYDTVLYNACKLSIYNRHNEIIFQANYPNTEYWDGKIQNMDAPIGTYFYKAEFIDSSRILKVKSGNFLLLR